jgi:cytochrome c oxidase assembly factor CtaG/putative copper export protein
MAMGIRAAAGVVFVAAGLLSLMWAYRYGGGGEPGLLDKSGPLVLWGLPVAKLCFNAAAACTIGALALGTYAVPLGAPAFARVIRFARGAAVLWVVFAAGLCVLSFHAVANTPPFSKGSGTLLVSFLAAPGPGRTAAATVLIAAVVAVLCFSVRSRREAFATALVAVAGLVPPVLSSHAAGGVDHADSTVSLALHVAAAAVWMGGLLTLFVLRRTLADVGLGTVVRRYSTLALASFSVLAVSGLLSAWAAIGGLDQLASPYGSIVLAKTAALVVLGAFGAVQRRAVIARLQRDPERGTRPFAVLVVLELVVMAAASGLAAALGRTSPPTGASSASSASVLPGPGIREAVSRWELDPLWTLLCGFAVVLYLAGVRRLRHSGERWPVRRTGLWLLGIAVLFMVTNGGLHVYQAELLSVHVLTQMLLTAVIPLLLVPAAPLTLAELAIRPETGATRGAGGFLRSALRPLLNAAAANPVIPALVLAATLVAFYYSPLLEYSARTQPGYGLMTLAALTSGCLFTAALTRPLAPSPPKARVIRFGVLAGTAVLYAVYGQALQAQAPVLGQPWETAAGNPWPASWAAAPETGGQFMLILAAVSLAALAVVVLFRSREEHRSERAQVGADKTPVQDGSGPRVR